MGHARITPQFCKECGSEKVRGGHNKFKCISPDCVEKRKAYAKQYRQDNKQALLEKRREYVEKNRESVDAYQKKYREEHKEEQAEWGRKHRAENAERISEQRAGYRAQNRDLINERQKDYYQRNRDERLAYAKEFRDEKMAPYYKMWDSIIQRCTNPSHAGYKGYGERGINLHEDWRKSYKEFEKYIVENLGHKPSDDHSIDRIDNNGSYVPGNLKWSTREEQQNNTRKSLKYKTGVPDDSLISYNNELITICEFSKLVGIHLTAVKYRYSQYPASSDWILSSDFDNRYYEWNGHKYNMAELSLISKIPYSKLFQRINNSGWCIEKAMNEK